MAKIYTKSGDKGDTGLFGGPRISKADGRLEAYGTLDELNSAIGWARTLVKSNGGARLSSLDQWLFEIQNELFNMGSHLAVGDEKMRPHLPPLSSQRTTSLEVAIDQMTNELTPLKEFILPGGSPIAAALHMSRTICRRAERRAVELHRASPVSEHILIYLNRLSDFLFVAARYANHVFQEPDVAWQKPPLP